MICFMIAYGNFVINKFLKYHSNAPNKNKQIDTDRRMYINYIISMYEHCFT